VYNEKKHMEVCYYHQIVVSFRKSGLLNIGLNGGARILTGSSKIAVSALAQYKCCQNTARVVGRTSVNCPCVWSAEY